MVETTIFDVYSKNAISDDDEDYNYDQGSGSGEYITTRPKREMTEGSIFSLTKEETTISGLYFYRPFLSNYDYTCRWICHCHRKHCW